MPIGMKMQGARPRARTSLILTGRSQPCCIRIHAVDVDAVAAEIVNIGEAVVRRERAKVGVCTFLVIRSVPDGRVMYAPDGWAQLALRNQETGSAPAAVIGRKKHPAAFVYCYMARALTGGVLGS